MKTDPVIAASLVRPGAIIHVWDALLQQTIPCYVHSTRPDGQPGWMVSSSASTLGPVKWDWDRLGWVFDAPGWFSCHKAICR